MTSMAPLSGEISSLEAFRDVRLLAWRVAEREIARRVASVFIRTCRLENMMNLSLCSPILLLLLRKTADEVKVDPKPFFQMILSRQT